MDECNYDFLLLTNQAKSKRYMKAMLISSLLIVYRGYRRNKAIKESERAAGNNIFDGKIGILCLLK